MKLLILFVTLCLLPYALAGSRVEGTLKAGSKSHIIVFELKNLGTAPIKVLTWGNPFDQEFLAPMFKITSKDNEGHHEALYQGIDVGRSTSDVDPETEVITIESGKTKSAEIDLKKGFTMDAGKYKVEIDFPILIVEEDNEGKLTDYAKQHHLKSFKIVAEENLHSAALTIDIDQHFVAEAVSQFKKETEFASKGEDRKGKGKEKSHAALVQLQSRVKARAIKIDDDACGDKVAAIRTMVTDAKTRLGEAVAWLGNHECTDAPNAHYTTWFGAKDAAGFRMGNVTRIINLASTRLANDEPSFTCHNPCYKASVLAYVYGTERPLVVHLCPPLYAHAASYKAATIIHEMTHLMDQKDEDRTRDHKYNAQPCKDLATNNPDTAVHNADNYFYFCENALPACH